jgi:hypothetical protein
MSDNGLVFTGDNGLAAALGVTLEERAAET